MDMENRSVSDEVLDFLTSSPTPEAIVAFKPSPAAQERLRYLLDANRSGILTPDERGELDEFELVDFFLSRLKTRARKKLAERADG